MLSLTRRKLRILLPYFGIITLVRIYCWHFSDNVVIASVDGISHIDSRYTNKSVTENDTTGAHQHHKTLESEIEKRFLKRRWDADLACSRAWLPADKQCRRNAVKSHLHLAGSYNSTFCAIEKAGSTFLKRILKALSTPAKQSKVSNPFDYKRGIVYNTEKNMGKFSDDVVWKRMKKTTNTIFVRDPYTRVFSFYLDKLYNTNTYFWSNFGTRIVKKERTNPSNTSLACGHDVTFNELISHLVNVMKDQYDRCPLDGHLSSNYDHCSPCHFNYTYIGKYETLHEDLHHVMLMEGMNKDVNLSNHGEQNDLDSFEDGAKFAFIDRAKIETCMSFVSSLRRVWQQTKSRGMLDKRAKFPFKETDNTTVTQKGFLEAMIKAYHEFDPKDRLLNRQEALSEAYRSLDQSLVRQFNEAFRLDFEIFGYQSIPPSAATSEYKYLAFY